MPAKEPEKPKRRRPVVEEVPETPPVPVPTPEPVVVPQTVETPAAEPTPVTTSPEIVEKKAEEVLKELETAHHDHKKSNRKINLKLLFGLTILIALIIGFVAGGLYVYTSGINGLDNGGAAEETPAPSSAPDPTPEPTPTPEPVDVSEFTVSILNGSGVIGAAGEAESLLEDAGFTVGNTGNASRFNYTDTVIQVKDGVVQSVIDQLEKALSEEYSVEVGDELPETSKYDIVITVGTE
jgi:hypothetical protein